MSKEQADRMTALLNDILSRQKTSAAVIKKLDELREMITKQPPSVNQNCPNGICAGGDINGNPSVTNNYGEPATRTLTDEQTRVLITKLATVPAPFWMITGNHIHGEPPSPGKPTGLAREKLDEAGAFELQVENVLFVAGWEDLFTTACKDVRNLYAAKKTTPDGETRALPPVYLHGEIDVTTFNVPEGCSMADYEEPERGVIIESPKEFMDSAELLNAELNALHFHSSVRRADLDSTGKKRLEFILIHVGPT